MGIDRDGDGILDEDDANMPGVRAALAVEMPEPTGSLVTSGGGAFGVGYLLLLVTGWGAFRRRKHLSS